MNWENTDTSLRLRGSPRHEGTEVSMMQDVELSTSSSLPKDNQVSALHLGSLSPRLLGSRPPLSFSHSPKAHQPSLLASGGVSSAHVTRKLRLHLLLPLLVLTILNHLDRANLSYAALQLNKQLGFGPHTYGLGASIFFVGYNLFQIPSNLALVRVGAHRWLAVLAVSWGIIAAGFAFVKSAAGFYTLRFLLGVAEAGTFPGVWYHLSLFFIGDDLSVAFSYIAAGNAFSAVIGGPIAAALLSMHGVLGLDGWQWLFIVEGLAASAMGVVIWLTLAPSVAETKFLRPAERAWLEEQVAAAQAKSAAEGHSEVTVAGALTKRRTWYLALISTLDEGTRSALFYWLPLILNAMLGGSGFKQDSPGPTHGPPGFHKAFAGPSPSWVALLMTVPMALNTALMLANAQHSKATGERQLHVVVPFAIGSLALVALAVALPLNTIAAFVALNVCMLLWAPNSILSAYPATFLHGTAVAMGFALLNTVSHCGGIFGPYLMGTLKGALPGGASYSLPVLVLAGIMSVVTLLALGFFREERLSEKAIEMRGGRFERLEEDDEEKETLRLRREIEGDL